MLPTFVIGLREGLEAALIVGIIAAFLRKQGRDDLVRWVFAGVAAAALLCVGVGVALDVLSKNLPQRQQEGLETVVGALAVAMVTYMVVWMRRHSRELKAALEGAAAAALADGPAQAGRAMVVMAFLAVLREGFETVVFLLAAFNESGNTAPAAAGAVLGIVVAVGLGYGIYRGGVSLNLSKFFRATGLVLVLVAAGLVLTALHTAHEAGWLNAGQGSTVDLSGLVRPGSVQASLLTGMLGVQAHPVVIEVIGWFAYLVPVGLYVGWPPGRSIAPRRVAVGTGLLGALAAVGGVVLALSVPALPAPAAALAGDGASLRVIGAAGSRLIVRPALAGVRAPDVTVRRSASVPIAGLPAVRYDGSVTQPFGRAIHSTLSLAAIANRDGGRLPLGLAAGSHAKIPVTYTIRTTVAVLVEQRTLRVVGGAVTREQLATLHAAVGVIPLENPVRTETTVLPAAPVKAAVAAARADLAHLAQRRDRRDAAVSLGVLAALLLAIGAGFGGSARRRRTAGVDTPPNPLVGHQVSLT